MKVYKLLSGAEWDAAKTAGRFEGSAVDRRDGFIHLSTAVQAPETARLHFAGQEGLVLLRLDADRLGLSLKWEPSRGGDLFPHLYGFLACALVEAETPLALGPDGAPELLDLVP
ncbi:MAG: DUF952 domain-containing protein [Caulobacteraceae bacterium]